MYRVLICYWFNCHWWYIDFFLKSTKTLRISHHNHLPLLKVVPDLGCKLPSNGSPYLLKLLFKTQAREPGGREPLGIRRKWRNQKADFLKARILSAPLQNDSWVSPHLFSSPHNLSTYIWMQCNWTREEKLRPDKFSLGTERKNSFSWPFWCTFLQCWIAILLLLRHWNLISRHILNNNNKVCVELAPCRITDLRAAHFKAGSC